VARHGFEVRHTYIFSAEYEFFGFHQTLLNLVSGSHNFFYNRAKKGRGARTPLRHPKWAAFVNSIGGAFLPVSGALALLGIACRRPACVELVCVRR